MSDLPAWLRCTCNGSCGADLAVTLRVGRTDAPPEVVAWPNRCPETGAELHHAPDTSPMILWHAWYDAVNAAVTEGTAPIPFTIDPRD